MSQVPGQGWAAPPARTCLTALAPACPGLAPCSRSSCSSGGPAQKPIESPTSWDRHTYCRSRRGVNPFLLLPPPPNSRGPRWLLLASSSTPTNPVQDEKYVSKATWIPALKSRGSLLGGRAQSRQLAGPGLRPATNLLGNSTQNTTSSGLQLLVYKTDPELSGTPVVKAKTSTAFYNGPNTILSTVTSERQPFTVITNLQAQKLRQRVEEDLTQGYTWAKN